MVSMDLIDANGFCEILKFHWSDYRLTNETYGF
jgi:hypothetical protein